MNFCFKADISAIKTLLMLRKLMNAGGCPLSIRTKDKYQLLVEGRSMINELHG